MTPVMARLVHTTVSSKHSVGVSVPITAEQYITVLYSTVLYSTVQYSTVQYSTAAAPSHYLCLCSKGSVLPPASWSTQLIALQKLCKNFLPLQFYDVPRK